MTEREAWEVAFEKYKETIPSPASSLPSVSREYYFIAVAPVFRAGYQAAIEARQCAEGVANKPGKGGICSCEEFQVGDRILTAFTLCSSLHGQGDYATHNGPLMRFCAWCGNRLVPHEER